MSVRLYAGTEILGSKVWKNFGIDVPRMEELDHIYRPGM